MFQHQITNTVENVLNTYLYRNVCNENHFHKGFEYVFVLKGELTATVAGETCRVTAGQGLLITPFQIHAFSSDEESVCYVVVFSGHWVESFAQIMTNKQVTTPLFTPDSKVEQYVKSVFLPELLPVQDSMQCPLPDPLSAKGALYAICADFLKKSELSDSPRRGIEWISDALFYIEANFTSDISLATMAETLGYNYEYLSRSFNQAMGIRFKSLLNQHRCEHARFLIENSQDSLTNIALASGFQSVRTFNHVFKEIMGCPPSALRK